MTSAKLRIYATSSSSNGPAVYTATDSAWSETAINWGNRPARSLVGRDDKGAVSANTWVEFDVTPFVAGNGTHTFVLATDSTDGLNMSSREARTPLFDPSSSSLRRVSASAKNFRKPLESAGIS